jgi:GntR family transcriptional regulator, vanillate catabolism transcriptional regulator
MAKGARDTQATRALLGLRELILNGRLAAGERISELQVVEVLGVSRTPLRAALIRLAAEGFLEEIPSGGYAVRGFTEQDVFAAIEVRGAMEGLAARFAAERGVSPKALAALGACLDEIDALVDTPGTPDLAAYITLNERFHDHIKCLCDCPIIEQQIDRANALPFASASSFVEVQEHLPSSRRVLTVAQDQHRCVVDAIACGEGTRAESLMREHARLAHRNLRAALADKQALNRVHGNAILSVLRN